MAKKKRTYKQNVRMSSEMRRRLLRLDNIFGTKKKK